MIDTIFIFLILLIKHTIGTAEEFGDEFCQLETFNPKCPTNEVVFIERAAFGRIRKGKCITEEELKSFGSLIYDKKYFHCSVDVTELLYNKCSFHQECSVPVSDKNLKTMNPCGQGLLLNLEVKYQCLSIYQVEKSDCHFQVLQTAKHFLFESFQSKTCGMQNNPWTFEASKGQKVSVVVIGQEEPANGAGVNYCEGLGIYLQDGYNGANSTLCMISQNGQTMKYRYSFTSTQNILKVYITDTTILNKKLALKCQAEGCLDIIPPEDAWLKRTNDDVVVGCYSSKLTWYLRCEQRQWVGTLGNCSYPTVQPIRPDDLKPNVDPKMMPKNEQILAIVCICGVGVVISSLIVCIGAVFARRYSFSNKAGPLKFANKSMHCEDSPYQYNTYSERYNFSNNLKNDNYDSKDQNKRLNSNTEIDQTYFVLEDEHK